jgi:ABC-2 type transport system permease protein
MSTLALLLPLKYRAVGRMGLRQALVERGGLIASSAFLLLILLVFSQLWEAMRETGALGALTASDLLWYLAVTEWIAIGTIPLWSNIQEDVRTGDLAYLLPRPMSYIGYKLADGYGRLAARMVVLGIASLGGAWAFSGSLPSEPLGLLFAIPLALLASCVLVIYYAWLGLLAFWLQDAQPVYFIFQKLLFVLGGLILPLTIYPDWLATLGAWTPFSAILYGPASSVHEANLLAVLWTATRLLLWGGVGVVLLAWTYSKALRSLVVNGG